MSIFDFLFSKKLNTRNELSNDKPIPGEDKRKAECPYCFNILNKIPGGKTKCPQCGQIMYVRTRPKDNFRLVVTKKEADKIDEEWAIVNGTHDLYLLEKKDFENEKKQLRKTFEGREPSDDDIKWGLLNKDLIKNARDRNWGLYRNTRFEMGEVLKKGHSFKNALNTYLEVCYLDFNGLNNNGGYKDYPQYMPPDFEPQKITDGTKFAPGVIDRIYDLIHKLNITIDQVEDIFMEHIIKVKENLKVPVSPGSCWLILREVLIEKIDL